MFVVDTNVLSELGRPDPDPNVVAWIKQQDNRLCLPAIVITELMFGVERMSTGRRKTVLRTLYVDLFSRLSSKILPFGKDEAIVAAALRARAESAGRPMSLGDAQVAAAAECRDATIATRNTRDYEIVGLPLIDPFDPSAQEA